jgi:glycosyltransferase involved in cell wall biosynthesis
MDPEISIVVPVYKNAETLGQLVRETEQALAPLGRSFELLFVVDACPRGSAAELSRLARGREHLRGIVLPHNHGQNWAVLVGLCQARGADLVVMDADLQDRPAAIPRLLATLGPGASVVFAGRRGRYESALRLLSSKMFKLSLRVLSGFRLPMDAGLFLAMTRPAADQLLNCRQGAPYVVGLLARTSAQMASVPIDRPARPTGGSAYSLRRRLRVALTGWRCFWPVLGDAAARPSFRERIEAMEARSFQGGEQSSCEPA